MEVLIALLVLSIGLLGLAALQSQGMRFNNEAYYRTQATQLAYEIIDAMRGNRDNVADYVITAADLDALRTSTACDVTSVVVDVQLSCWINRLTDMLPSAEASIATNANNAGTQFYVDVTVSWMDRELSTSTLDTNKTQARCEEQPNRTWDATATEGGSAAGICRINQIWTVMP